MYKMNQCYNITNKNNILQNNDNIEKNSSAFYCTQITLNRRHLHYF